MYLVCRFHDKQETLIVPTKSVLSIPIKIKHSDHTYEHAKDVGFMTSVGILLLDESLLDLVTFFLLSFLTVSFISGITSFTSSFGDSTLGGVKFSTKIILCANWRWNCKPDM